MPKPEQLQASAEREVYLAEVTRQLSARMSALETYESVEELRNHINSMAEAYMEMGLDSQSAMAAALGKFGPAVQLGSALASTATTDGQESRQSAMAQISPSLPLTFLLAFLSSFVLLQACDWSFVSFFSGRSTGAWATAMISFPAAVIVAPIAWFFSRWSSIAIGALLSAALNIFLGLTLYPTYIELGEPVKLAHLAVSLSIATFVLGTVTGAGAQFFKLRFPQSPQANRNQARAR